MKVCFLINHSGLKIYFVTIGVFKTYATFEFFGFVWFPRSERKYGKPFFLCTKQNLHKTIF